MALDIEATKVSSKEARKYMRTEVKVERAEYPFSYGQEIQMMGSCFSEHIGKKLKDLKFNIDLNPFGVLYNPVSIASGIQRMVNQHPFEESDLFFHQGWWHSFDHHSCFSNPVKEECLRGINNRLDKSGVSLRNATHLFITFGTSWVFHQKSNGRVVSNCHQVPDELFETQLLRVGDIVRMYTILIQEIAEINPGLDWIFTVSPVRHWKNGPEGNQLSKSTLILAVNELKQKFDQVGYFPAYEIFMDDLRDYRFYADDLLHPGTQGIEYTWDKFKAAYITDEAQSIMKAIESLIRAKNHRPRNTGSSEHKDFIKKQKQKATILANNHPDIDLYEFVNYFDQRTV